ncbi:MAG: ExbD/TolR family protein [Gemmatimonadaceae bacterium]
MHTAPASEVQATPNVTPMIDVMLVLLVIFMVVAPALLAGTAAVPPAAAWSVSRPEDPADHVLGIDAQGRLNLGKASIAHDELPALLQSIYGDMSGDRILYIRADKDVDYGVVLDAMRIARQSGVAVVGMITEQRLAPVRR